MSCEYFVKLGVSFLTSKWKSTMSVLTTKQWRIFRGSGGGAVLVGAVLDSTEHKSVETDSFSWREKRRITQVVESLLYHTQPDALPIYFLI